MKCFQYKPLFLLCMVLLCPYASYGFAPPFSEVTGNNAQATARALTLDAIDGQTAIDPILDSLSSLTDLNELENALNAMQPSLFKGAIISNQNSIAELQTLLFNKDHTSLNAAHSFSLQPPNRSQIPCAQDLSFIKVWAAGAWDGLFQGSRNFDGSPQESYHSSLGLISLGIEAPIGPYCNLGALTAYTGSSTKWAFNQGKISIDSGYFGLYFSAYSDLFYLNTSLIGGWSSFQGSRLIAYPGVETSAHNKHGSAELLTHGDTGINFSWKGLSFRPFDSFDYLSLSENGFKETGAGAYNLTLSPSTSILLRNELGFELGASLCTTNAKWTLSPRISWVRQVRLKGSSYQSAFENTTVSFRTTGFFPNRSLVAPGLILSGMFGDGNATILLSYGGEYGYKYSNSSFSGQLQIGF